MYNFDLIQACTDLGVNVDGASNGPKLIVQNIDETRFYNIVKVEQELIKKSKEKNDLKKNFSFINRFNNLLYQEVKKSTSNGNIPLTLGGDHSLSIGSALASIDTYSNLGLIWFDAHGDFNTFNTTITGNIHGVPFATITGCNGDELSFFSCKNYFNPKNCVLIGARSIDYPGEVNNLKDAGITIFTTEDLINRGYEKIFNEAINIALNGTNGMHCSLDVDVIDPLQAPGVSVPEKDGISKEIFLNSVEYLMKYIDKIKSIDLVEFNPLFDKNNLTLDIVLKAIKIINP